MAAAEAAPVLPTGMTSTPASPSASIQAVTDIYRTQYDSLVRLAALLTGDAGAAEDVVQESFVALHRTWHRLRTPDRALRYLRQSVVSRSRSVPRSSPARRIAPRDMPDEARAGPGPAAQPDPSPIISAICALPPTQREALVLTYYLGLPERQVASAMGVSRGAVRSHTARAVAVLKDVLELPG
jgi:RNA polymerase sigma-70 factor (sigma-E family)